MSANLLVELLTEELPPKALKRLSEAFADGIADGLVTQGFTCRATGTRHFCHAAPPGRPSRRTWLRAPPDRAAEPKN